MRCTRLRLCAAATVAAEKERLAALLAEVRQQQELADGRQPTAPEAARLEHFPAHRFTYLCNTQGRHRKTLRSDLKEMLHKEVRPHEWTAGAQVIFGPPAPAYTARIAEAHAKATVVVTSKIAAAVSCAHDAQASSERLHTVRASETYFPTYELFAHNSIDAVVLPFPMPYPARQHAHMRVPHDKFIDTLHIKLRVGGIFGFVTDSEPFYAFVGTELHRTFADWDVLDAASPEVGHLAPRAGDFEREPRHMVWLRKSKLTEKALEDRLMAYDFSRLKLRALDGGR
jgi:hypothetical protein